MTHLARSSIALVTLASGLCLPAAAQSITPLVLEGDSVPGVGNVTGIDNLAVNASGSWIAEIDTDNPDTTADGALLKDGALYLREGQALAAPAGASLGSFDAIGLNASGHSGWNFFLDGTTGIFDDSGIYFDDVLVIQEGDVSGAAGFSAGTPYIGFFEALLNGSNEILIVASVDDPAIASTVDRALVVATVDGTGALLGETVLAKEGDVLAGQTEAVADFGTGPHAFDFNDAGQVLFIADLTGDTTLDGCIYLDGTLLAQEGSPSPVAGRSWSSLSTSQRVALGNGGDWVHTGSLDGSSSDNLVLIRNGALFRQEGETLPVFAPFQLTGFGTSTPVDIDDAGNVLWFGDWDDPDTARDTGLFLNDTLLVREGVTLIGGQLVTSLSSIQDAFELSPDGRYVIFEATLEGGVLGAFLIDLQGACPAPVAYCTAKPSSIPGCVPAFATTGTPSASAGSGFQIDCGPVPGKNVGLFIYSTDGALSTPLSTPFGFLCLNGFLRLSGMNAQGSTGTCSGNYGMDFNAFLATQTSDPNLVAGALVDLQVWYRDPPNGGNANFSGALHFTICP